MDSFQPVTVSRRSSVEERQTALCHIYQQVLERQPYRHERDMLAKLEKDFLADKIGVRRFLKELGQSDLYLNAFYYEVSNLQFLAWCFKHFMGRALTDREEMQIYCKILMTKGVQSVVTAILDSEEYRKVFGCFTVPYPRSQEQYASPRAYLDNQMLNHNYVRQQYVRQQEMKPDLTPFTADRCGVTHRLPNHHTAGHRHSQIDAILDVSMLPTEETIHGQLLALLKALDAAQARKMIATLPPEQKEALRKAIRR